MNATQSHQSKLLDFQFYNCNDDRNKNGFNDYAGEYTNTDDGMMKTTTPAATTIILMVW